MTEKEESDIDNNIVDLPQLKCVPYCFKQKRWCDRTDEGRADPVKDADLIKNLGHLPEVKKMIKKALNAWNYYLTFRNATIKPSKDRESGFVTWFIKKAAVKYTEKDIMKATLIKGTRLSVVDREMIGIVMKNGEKMRFLLDKSFVGGE